jgi:hypothetical protein
MQRAGPSGWEATGHRRASESRLAPALSLLFLPLHFRYPQFKASATKSSPHREFVRALRQYSTSAVQHHIRVREQIRLPETVSIRILCHSPRRSFPMQRAGSSGWEAKQKRAPEGQRVPSRASPFTLFLPLHFLYPQFKALSHQIVLASQIRAVGHFELCGAGFSLRSSLDAG